MRSLRGRSKRCFRTIPRHSYRDIRLHNGDKKHSSYKDTVCRSCTHTQDLESTGTAFLRGNENTRHTKQALLLLRTRMAYGSNEHGNTSVMTQL